MTVREALSEGHRALKGLETETPQLDASLLLAFARGTSRERLYMDLREQVGNDQMEEYRRHLERRASGEPVAWITGIKEFWGLNFAVGPGVLCPRPDTEVLVEAALEVMDALESGPGSVHDCCCGPGTVAVALAAERPLWQVSASDISEEAARFFALNNRMLSSNRVRYVHADLMAGLEGPFDIIVSNPPYLTPAETEERTALGWKEPVLALDGGGSDGLDLIRSLMPRAWSRLSENGVLLLEADPLQMPVIRSILSAAGFSRTETRPDLAGRERVAIGFKASK